MKVVLWAWFFSAVCLQADLSAQVSIAIGSPGKGAAVSIETRDWRNLEGRIIRAKLRGYDGVTAKLEMDGRIYPVPKNKLSLADQTYLDAWLNRQPGALPENKMPTLSDGALETAPELDLRKVEKLVHAVVNRERLKLNLGELDWHDQVAAIARAHSEDMATRNYFSHVNPEGEDPSARAARQGWTASKGVSEGEAISGLTENIGRIGRYHSLRREVKDGNVARFLVRWFKPDQMAEQIVKGWLNSPSHRKNMLDPERELEGIGLGIRREHIYVTQNLF